MGESKNQGYGVQFYVDNTRAAVSLPTGQATGMTYGSYDIYWRFTSSCSFTNDGNHYEASMLEAAYISGEYQGAFGYETLIWEWTEGYPF